MPQTLTPSRTVTRAECVAEPSARRCSCPTCGKTFAGGAIVTDEALWCAHAECFAVVRRCYCDHCDHVFVWSEPSDVLGRPLPGGVILSGPALVRGRRSVDRFLSRHPQSAGVTDA